MNPITSATLSDHVYNGLSPDATSVTIAGIEYEILARRDSSTGYQGTVYRKVETDEVIVAHRGTEFDHQPLLDGGIDAAMVTARVNAQLGDALALTKQAIKLADERGIGPVHVTGHSLGGALAQITAHHYNLPGDAFNPYGAAGLAYRLPEGQPANAAPFTNHVMAGDLVSAGGPHYGKVEMYALPKELEVLRNAEQGQRIASLGTLGMKSGHVMSAAVAVQLGDSHRLVHFLDRMTDKGPVQSVLDNPQARITDPEDLRRIADYRSDVHRLRAAATVLVGGGPGLLRDGVNYLRGTEDAGAHARHEAETEQRAHDALKPGEPLIQDATDKGSPSLRNPAFSPKSPLQESIESTLDKAGLDPSEEGHPDHALYRQIRDGVSAVDARHGRSFDETSERMTASLLAAAKSSGLERVDHVVLGNPPSDGSGPRMFVVQGALDNPAHLRASVVTSEAISTPVEHSLAKVEQMLQAQQVAQQDHTQEQARTAMRMG
ncbi:hemolysin [Stenotrophomonas maltophilia]|uniref:XVIPCD domain-containing protein n=1 Tax=Stenotrophomonas TaxID=40323 RepID=UPI0013114F65|nr:MULTISPECIES: XVIPCD domain-containing protein [Stenotrophomonas]ELC7323980.1 hemolysin [Stenotrophomonas maltophilia]MBA0279282.1 hemolysin [Stenotrophomonas maltophilia]MBA0414862.1 hemolysin [Stenotrophomonas maltophilia]MBA0500242.1 hemolysin [Stenotrophomonas maltophilia]MBA0504686.1 hemolysin [Stenotrophomonas maltophilia]